MLKCIVIDDEQPAIDIMKHHINKVSELELVGTFTNPIEAIQFIKNHRVDLLFLDIQMNEMTGIDVMYIVDENIKIILCTAFSEYAIDGFNNNAVDYLLKPISFERFTKAIKKVMPNVSKEDKEQDYIYIKTEQKGKFIKVYYDEIDYVEAMGNYISIHKGKEKVLVYSTMKDMENVLPSNLFMRVHKSYIISMDKISMIENGFVLLKSGAKISVGTNYKDSLMQKIKQNLL